MQYTSPFKPIFSPVSDAKNAIPADQHRFYDIVKQFSDAQSLSELQSDIFGSSAPQLQEVAPELALPRYLEPAAAAAVAANTDRASRKRKLDDIVLAPAPAPTPATTAAASTEQPQQQQQQDRSSKRRKTSSAVAAASASSATTTPAPTQSTSSYKPTSAGSNSSSNAKQNHNRSEQQRRQRINDAIEELRVILPPQCRNLATNKLAILQESAGFMRHMKESLDALHREKERSEEAYKQLWEEHTLLRNSVAASEGGLPSMFSPIHSHNNTNNIINAAHSSYPSPPPFMSLSHPTSFDASQIVLPPSYMGISSLPYLDSSYGQL